MEVYFTSNIKHYYYIYCVCYILLTILLFSFIVFNKLSDLVFHKVSSLIKITVFVHVCARKWNISCMTNDLSYVCRQSIDSNMISRSEGRYTIQVIILNPPHNTTELSLTPIINGDICKACYFTPPNTTNISM